MRKKLSFIILILIINLVFINISYSQTPEWAKRVIKVTGTGAILVEKYHNYAVAKLMARRAAILDGYRQLLESLKGIKIDSRTSVKDFVTEYDEIKGEIKGIVRGAEITAVRYNPDGTVEVDMILDLKRLWELIKDYTFFNTPVLPGFNVFVIDSSGSMSDRPYNPKFRSRWEMAVYELKKVIKKLKLNTPESPQYFGIIFFADNIKKYFYISKVTPSNKILSYGIINKVSPGGATNYYQPLKKAMDWLNSLNKTNYRRTIYLLGDGEPNRGPFPYWRNIYNLARNLKNIRLNVIYCGSSNYNIERKMQKLAQIGGGVFRKEK